MTSFITVSVVVALLGSALVGGIFFAFSSFIMGALGRIPSGAGITSMQSINIVVLNRSFLGLFMGTAAVCALVGGLAIANWGVPGATYFLAGALSYLIGTFLVTALGNVPLNEKLALLAPEEAEAAAFWQHYLQRWTLLNTVRTVMATGGAALFTLGLVVG